MIIILDEKNYAERCLKENVIAQDKNPYQVLSILAKYYYHICGYRKKKIYTHLLEYLQKYYPRYESNAGNWENSLSKLASTAGKEDLFIINGVKITKQELSKIQSIKNKTKEKLLFTMLCIAKLNICKNPKSNGWVNIPVKDIFTMARVSCNSFEQQIKIGELQKLGLLEFPKKNGNLNIRITFIDNDGDEELFISDFRELGYEYLLYRGEDYIRCVECSILTRGNKSGTKKYCKSCSGYTPKDKKIITCVDCGKEFEVKGKNTRTIRCLDCQRNKQLEYQRISMAKLRNVK